MQIVDAIYVYVCVLCSCMVVVYFTQLLQGLPRLLYVYRLIYKYICMCVSTQLLHSKHTNSLRAEVVTSIWGNGDTGPLFVHLPESSSSAHIVADLNAKFGGKLKVVISRTGSHFMNAEATIVYYEEPSAQVVYIGVWGV